MPIPVNKAQKRVAASTSTHNSNDYMKPPVPELSGQDVENNMSVDTLIDPEDYESGSTVISNDAPFKPDVPTATAVKASIDGSDGGSPLNPDSNNVGTLPNDTDPGVGVIEGAVEPETLVLPNDEAETSVDVDAGTTSGVDLVNNEQVTPLSVNSALEDLDPDAAQGEDDDWDAAPLAPEDGDAVDDDLEEEAAIADVEEAPLPEELPVGGDDVSMLDIDEVADDDQDVAFAAFNGRLMAIRANRIIATMTKKMAIASNRGDIYLSDQFQQVTASQIGEKGLRKGLKSMGFALATVSFGKQATIKAAVQKQMVKANATLARTTAEKDAAFEQSLAIASVGINRQMFKNEVNPLRAALEHELRVLNIRGAGKIVARAFAEHGTSYAKQVITLAKKISAMPEEVRDGYVDALDLDSGVCDEPGEEMVPIGAEIGDDFGGTDDMDDDLEDGFGQTIEAALARGGHRIQASSKVDPRYSVTANQVLSGKVPLFSI